jgi:integrase
MIMAVRRESDGKWRYRKVVKLPDGGRVRISGTPSRNTREAAEQAERAHIDRTLKPALLPETKEVPPTFGEWFNGDFWTQWVVGRKNKASEVESKRSIYQCHLEQPFAALRLDEIGECQIAEFRAKLVAMKKSDKRINNILAVLSKPLHYAADLGVIPRAPKVGLLKVERPEIRWWGFAEYARILEAARVEGPEWYAAVCLAGEAGLRVGEVKALRWSEDVDLVARTITVNQQIRHGIIGTPKGGRRRTVPVTQALFLALRRLEVAALTDGQTTHAIRRIIRRAALPARGWHSLRHSFGTHGAMLGVNPWRLQAWMGHRRIDETMLYVHMAGVHHRPTPPELLQAAGSEVDPDRRILLMLGARVGVRDVPAAIEVTG